jgi:hypothetical protein
VCCCVCVCFCRSASAETLNLPGGTNATRGYTWTRPRAMYASEPVTLSEFSESEPLSIPAGASADYNDGMFTYLNTVPTLDNGMVLVGELSKQVPVSRQRIATISAAAGSKTIELGVLGAPGETVEMSYLEKVRTTPIKVALCTTYRILVVALLSHE